jgi:hypothetical protein
VATFYSELGIRKLPVYIDPSGEALHALDGIGLRRRLCSTTPAKRSPACIVGPAEWDAPKVAEFLKPMMRVRTDKVTERNPSTHGPPMTLGNMREPGRAPVDCVAVRAKKGAALKTTPRVMSGTGWGAGI